MHKISKVIGTAFAVVAIGTAVAPAAGAATVADMAPAAGVSQLNPAAISGEVPVNAQVDTAATHWGCYRYNHYNRHCRSYRWGHGRGWGHGNGWGHRSWDRGHGGGHYYHQGGGRPWDVTA